MSEYTKNNCYKSFFFQYRNINMSTFNSSLLKTLKTPVSPHSPMLIRLIYLNKRGGQAPPLLRCDSLKSWESVAMASVHLKRRRHTQNCTNNVNERSGSCSPEPAAVLQVMTIRRVPADCFTRNTILHRLIII